MDPVPAPMPGGSHRALGRAGERWALAGLAGFLLVLGAFLHTPVAPGGMHDDGVYLLLGRALAEGQGFVYAGVPGDPPASKFPPGYPLVVAAAWDLAGGAVDTAARLLAVWNSLAVAATGVALARFGLRRLSLPLFWALLPGVAWGLLVDPWRYALLPLSEPLAILFMVLAVDAATGVETGVGEGPQASARMARWALGLFGFAIHLRSAAAPLGLAMAAGILFRGLGRRGIQVASGALLLGLPWFLLSATWSTRIPEVLRDILGSYGGWFGGAVIQDPLGFGTGSLSRAGQLPTFVLAALLPEGVQVARWLGLVPAVLVAAGLQVLWRGSRTAALLLGGLALQCIAWPFFDSRLLLPLLPWVLLGLCLGVRRVTAGIPRAAMAAAAIACLIQAASLVQLAGRPGGIGGGEIRSREATTAAAVAAVRDWVPPGRVVGAPELWAILHLRTGHPVAPSARFRPGAVGLERAGTPEEQFRLWAVAGFDALLAEGEVHDEALRVMREACGPGAFSVPAAGPGFRLVRLEWDDACRRRLVPGWGGVDP